MSEMMKVYQEINKRRQSDEMDVNSLTMFTEAWYFRQAKIDNLQKQAITQGQNFNDLAQKLKDAEYFNQKLQIKLDAIREYILENHVEGEDAEFTGKVVNLIETEKLLEMLK